MNEIIRLAKHHRPNLVAQIQEEYKLVNVKLEKINVGLSRSDFVSKKLRHFAGKGPVVFKGEGAMEVRART